MSNKHQNLRNLKNAKERRTFVEQELKIQLPNVGYFSLDEEVAGTRHCENMIGVAQVPMGIVGPLKVRSQKYEVRSYFIPLATTEGALVASVNRGCKAITASGGASVLVERVGTTRGPVFNVQNMGEMVKLRNWVAENFHQLQQAASTTSSHLKLLNYDFSAAGRYVYFRFYFDTQDAMGMNMVTIATTKIIKLIEQQTSIPCLSVAGNFDVDKKASWLNVVSGRGKKVWAEAAITAEMVKQVLKTTPQKICDVWLGKCMIGSAMSGSLGFNAQFANIIAAIFIATGQDPAHVVEGSMGITTTEVAESGDLYISVYLPSLMIGTVGGGTGLATQSEALRILGIAGDSNGHNVLRFAEIVGGAVLAGELSLLASLAQGSLAKAHNKLARGKFE